MSANTRDLIKELLGPSISFRPMFARIAGSASAGLMLSQAYYWTGVQERTRPELDGWFYKTQQEWEEEICLSRWEQESARKLLRELAFWKEELRGAPAKLFFRVDLESLYSAIDQYVGKPHTSLRKNHSTVCGKTSNQVAGKPQTLFLNTENTSESTTEIGETSAAPPPGDPRHRAFAEFATETFRTNHNGQLPAWSGKDWKTLSALLQRELGLSVDEMRRRWASFLASSDRFIRSQGDSLAFFCSNFDRFIDGPLFAGTGGTNGNSKPSIDEQEQRTRRMFAAAGL